ncbi:ankyrin repeat domain-containing protein [Sulfuricurvum sp.]|uniref:ankyrin repeat domain-containing protein n=1 Tax=Sulfuricurvum sp. TaxID=2025608 RepID=UPI00261FB994|nr:ankyrin repeat domain-containing protein [Sulfuricurvum sp.]MDD3596675.1 ankyrin repeat domain-containing protein [Sulfuricurvum sp.]
MEDNLYFFIPKSRLDHYGLTLDSSENEVAQAISGEEGPLYGDDLIPNFDYIEKAGYSFPVFEPGDDFGIAVTWEITSGMCTDMYSGSFKEFRPYVEKLNEVLMRAAESGNIDDAKEALANGAEIDNNTQSAGWTPLQRAASYGHFEMVRFLENNGANLHEGYSFAFRRAVANGHNKIAIYLADNGADIYHGNNEALHTALNRGNVEMAKYIFNTPELIEQLQEMIDSKDIDLTQPIDEIVEAYMTAYHYEIEDASDGDMERGGNEVHSSIETAIAIMKLQEGDYHDQQCDFSTMLQRATSEDLGMGFITPEKAEELYTYASQFKNNRDLEGAVDSLKKTDNGPKMQ